MTTKFKPNVNLDLNDLERDLGSVSFLSRHYHSEKHAHQFSVGDKDKFIKKLLLAATDPDSYINKIKISNFDGHQEFYFTGNGSDAESRAYIDDRGFMVALADYPMPLVWIAEVVKESNDADLNSVEFTTFQKTPLGLGDKNTFYDQSDFGSFDAALLPYLDSEKMVDLYLNSNDSILILSGNPGSGKTSLIRKILIEVCSQDLYRTQRVVYAKNKEMIESEEFWESLAGFDDIGMVIFDDLDYVLGVREEEKSNTFVSNLLSMSNGIFSKPIKFVISTNVEPKQIDPAILRPKRCFDHLKIRFLTKTEAFDIWTSHWKLESSTFDKFFSDKENVSQSELLWRKETLEMDPDGYVREPGISIRHEILKQEPLVEDN